MAKHNINRDTPDQSTTATLDMPEKRQEPIHARGDGTALYLESNPSAETAAPEKKKQTKEERAQAKLEAAKLGMKLAELMVQTAEAELRMIQARKG